MTTTTMTAIARPAFGLDRAALWLLLAFVAALQLSIAVAGILLTASLAAWARDRGEYYSVEWKARPGAEADPAFRDR